MPILSSEIKVYYATGSATADIASNRTNAANGGAISITEVADNTVNNLFPDITGDEAAAGVTKYCKIFIKNTHGSLTWQNAKAWVSSVTPGTDNEISLALEATSNDTTPPAADSFSTPTTKGAGLTLGNVANGGAVALWVRWVVNAGATAKANEAATIRAEGDSQA